MKTFPGYVAEFGIDYKSEKRIFKYLIDQIGDFTKLPKRIPLLLIVLKSKRWGQEIFDVIQNEQINNCLKKDIHSLIESGMISLRRFKKGSDEKYYSTNLSIILGEIEKSEPEKETWEERFHRLRIIKYRPGRLSNPSYYNLDDD